MKFRLPANRYFAGVDDAGMTAPCLARVRETTMAHMTLVMWAMVLYSADQNRAGAKGSAGIDTNFLGNPCLAPDAQIRCLAGSPDLFPIPKLLERCTLIFLLLSLYVRAKIPSEHDTRRDWAHFDVRARDCF